MEEIDANIHLCVCSIDRSISRGLTFTLGLDRKKPPRFPSLYRSSCVGKVIQGVEEQLLTDLQSPFQRSEQHERTCKLKHSVIFTQNAVRRVTNLL